ncbi:MAG: GUN4 domain-containing protein [Synechococcales bacterium]|nr:GUN4 domain-containing protein [Synechococcales bacterium]
MISLTSIFRSVLPVLGLGAIACFSPLASLAQPQPLLATAPSNANLPQTPIEELKSSVRIDYEPLQQLLRAGKWEDANQMTSTLMLQAGGQLERGYLMAADIRKLPCADLRTVDKLWRYYSRDRFGYSVQAGIWIRMRGKNAADVSRFAGRVGWHRGIANFNLNAQVGHLPLRPGSSGGVADAAGGEWIQTMPKRLSLCTSSPKPKTVTPKKSSQTPPGRSPNAQPKL